MWCCGEVLYTDVYTVTQVLLHACTMCFDLCPEDQVVLYDGVVTVCMTAGAGKVFAC